MRKSLIAVIGVLMVAATYAAQIHDNAQESKATDELSIVDATRVGTVVLKPGDYRVFCDRSMITFTRLDNFKRVQLPCKGKVLDKKSGITQLVTDIDKDGTRYVKTFLLRGSNVEHVFD